MVYIGGSTAVPTGVDGCETRTKSERHRGGGQWGRNDGRCDTCRDRISCAWIGMCSWDGVGRVVLGGVIEARLDGMCRTERYGGKKSDEGGAGTDGKRGADRDRDRQMRASAYG